MFPFSLGRASRRNHRSISTTKRVGGLLGVADGGEMKHISQELYLTRRSRDDWKEKYYEWSERALHAEEFIKRVHEALDSYEEKKRKLEKRLLERQ